MLNLLEWRRTSLLSSFYIHVVFFFWLKKKSFRYKCQHSNWGFLVCTCDFLLCCCWVHFPILKEKRWNLSTCLFTVKFDSIHVFRVKFLLKGWLCIHISGCVSRGYVVITLDLMYMELVPEMSLFLFNIRISWNLWNQRSSFYSLAGDLLGRLFMG